jgi:hypothetical protein
MDYLPIDIYREICSFCNIIDCANLSFVNFAFYEIIYFKQKQFYQTYKNIIKINISDFNFIKDYLLSQLQTIYPSGYNVKRSISNIIGNDEYISYSKLTTLITILKIGKSLLLSTSYNTRVENTNLNNWIKIAYLKYINCLAERRQMVRENIITLIFSKKIKL